MYCVLMAGGSGTRFWPQSREKIAKQFLKLINGSTLIEETLKRFQSFTEINRIYIVSNINQKNELERHKLDLPHENMVFEPIAKNTAPCIALAALTISHRDKDPDAVMVVSPADHLIRQQDRFRKSVLGAVQLAKETDGLVTIGIKPDKPATGYGYIQISSPVKPELGIDSFNVRTFAEKPNYQTALNFLKSGDFYWNSGLFVFKVHAILRAIEEYLPDLYDAIMPLAHVMDTPQYSKMLETVYRQINGISIDYAVMEKAKNVYLVKGDFDWSDLGSWEEAYKQSPNKDAHGNAAIGDVVLLDTKNSYVSGNVGVIAVLGLEDVVIVQDNDATLICKRDRVEDVKQMVERMRRGNMKKYL